MTSVKVLLFRGAFWRNLQYPVSPLLTILGAVDGNAQADLRVGEGTRRAHTVGAMLLGHTRPPSDGTLAGGEDGAGVHTHVTQTEAVVGTVGVVAAGVLSCGRENKWRK